MYLWIITLTATLLAVPAKAEYMGVAGEYDGMAEPAPEAPTLSQAGDFVGVADGFYNDAPQPTPPLFTNPAPISLTTPRDTLPTVTITPNALGASSSSASEGNFTFVPEGAAPPPAPEQPLAMTAEERAIANNYPVNAYDGEITAAHPVMKQFNETPEVSGLNTLDHGDVFEGRNAMAGNGPRTVTVNNNSDWVDIWQNQIGAAPPGRLSRGQKAVVIFDPKHAYSGYTAEVEIADEDAGRISVNANHIVPSQRSAISPDNSSPYAAIVLDAAGKTVDVREGKKPAG